MINNSIAIYVHWPFCKSKCPYCDFNSHVREKIEQNSWEQSYIQEINYFVNSLEGKTISSIFFGGGTPSLMDPNTVYKIINHLTKIANFSNNIEITLEANPTSIEANKFKDFRSSGVNRVSIGIQSLDESSLKFLGRTHSRNEGIEAIEIASQIFDNYSFDLIYARPEQSLKDWEKELMQALILAKNHISLYQLTIEKGTSFYSDYKNKKFIMPNELISQNMYLLTKDITNQFGFIDYEISNYAKKGYESLHNSSYWNYDDYLGIGPGAHSRLNAESIVMIHNPENWQKSVSAFKHGIQNQKKLSIEERVEEYVIMNLRKINGINKHDFLKKIGKELDTFINVDKLKILKKKKLINEDDNYISTTLNGRLVLNKVIEYLLSGFHI